MNKTLNTLTQAKISTQTYQTLHSSFKSILPRFITPDEAKKMSKYRVIQKNLVHVQGFPDSIIPSLDSFEFLGQFGKIIKLVIVKGKDKDDDSPKSSTMTTTTTNIKKSNSAYITFASNEEAALAVLSIDSFCYENHLIRAFFGTSKYCLHFLNNKECFNKDKCMYLHSIASETDVLGNTCGLYSKFDYSEHLQIALAMSGVLTKEKRDRINKLRLTKSTVFPNIKSIYNKDIVIQGEKRLNHNDLASLLSINGNVNANGNSNINGKRNRNGNTNGKGSGRSSTNDEDDTSKSSGNDQDYPLYHYRMQSRFFNDVNNTNTNNCNTNSNSFNSTSHSTGISSQSNTNTNAYTSAFVPFYLIELVDKTLSRYSFFNYLSSYSTNANNNDHQLKQQRDHILNDPWSEITNSNNTNNNK